MSANFKTILLFLCLVMISSVHKKKLHHDLKNTTTIEGNNSQHDPKNTTTEEHQSPSLVQTKLKEAIKEKFASKVKQAAPTAPATTAPATTAPATTAPATTAPTTTAPTTTAPATTQPTPNYQANISLPPVDEDDKFYYKRNIQCTNVNCQLPYGTCVDGNTCRCLDGFVEFETEEMKAAGTISDFYCQYKQKRQLVAFLLEFFISLGTGHFYTGRILFGVFKLLIMLGPIILGVLMCCCAFLKDSDSSSCLGLITMIGSCLFVLTGLVWQLVDVIMFGINKYYDGNGAPLQHW